MDDLHIDELVNIYNDLNRALDSTRASIGTAFEAHASLKRLLLQRGDAEVDNEDAVIQGNGERAIAGGDGVRLPVPPPPPPPPAIFRRAPPKPKPRPKVAKAIKPKVLKRGAPPKEAADKPAKRGRPRKAADGDKPAPRGRPRKAAKPAKVDKPAKAAKDKPMKAAKAVTPAKVAKAAKPKVVHPPGKDHPRYNLKLMSDYKAKFLLAAGKPQGRPPAAWKGSDEEQDALRLLAERNP